MGHETLGGICVIYIIIYIILYIYQLKVVKLFASLTIVVQELDSNLVNCI